MAITRGLKVAVTGSKATNSGYATMLQGVNLAAFNSANINLDNTRVMAVMYLPVRRWMRKVL